MINMKRFFVIISIICVATFIVLIINISPKKEKVSSINDADCISYFYDKETGISIDFLLQPNTVGSIKCNLLFKNNSNKNKTINLQSDYFPNMSIIMTNGKELPFSALPYRSDIFITMTTGEDHKIVNDDPDAQKIPTVLRPGETIKISIAIGKNAIRNYVNAESVSIRINRFSLYYDESQSDNFSDSMIRLTVKLPKEKVISITNARESDALLMLQRPVFPEIEDAKYRFYVPNEENFGEFLFMFDHCDYNLFEAETLREEDDETPPGFFIKYNTVCVVLSKDKTVYLPYKNGGLFSGTPGVVLFICQGSTWGQLYDAIRTLNHSGVYTGIFSQMTEPFDLFIDMDGQRNLSTYHKMSFPCSSE